MWRLCLLATIAALVDLRAESCGRLFGGGLGRRRGGGPPPGAGGYGGGIPPDFGAQPFGPSGGLLGLGGGGLEQFGVPLDGAGFAPALSPQAGGGFGGGRLGGLGGGAGGLGGFGGQGLGGGQTFSGPGSGLGGGLGGGSFGGIGGSSDVFGRLNGARASQLDAAALGGAQIHGFNSNGGQGIGQGLRNLANIEGLQGLSADELAQVGQQLGADGINRLGRIMLARGLQGTGYNPSQLGQLVQQPALSGFGGQRRLGGLGSSLGSQGITGYSPSQLGQLVQQQAQSGFGGQQGLGGLGSSFGSQGISGLQGRNLGGFFGSQGLGGNQFGGQLGGLSQSGQSQGLGGLGGQLGRLGSQFGSASQQFESQIGQAGQQFGSQLGNWGAQGSSAFGSQSSGLGGLGSQGIQGGQSRSYQVPNGSQPESSLRFASQADEVSDSRLPEAVLAALKLHKEIRGGRLLQGRSKAKAKA